MRILTIIFATIVLFCIYALTPYSAEKFEVGAYYVKTYEPSDPYEKIRNDTIRILDRKGTYYKYVKKPQYRKDDYRFYSSFKSSMINNHTYKKLPNDYKFDY